jgi:subtilisin family serine protease
MTKMKKILDNNYYDLIISNTQASSYTTGDNVTYLNKNNSLLHVPVNGNDPCDLGKYSYNSFPSLYTLTSSSSLEKSGIAAVQRNPSLALFGQGVLAVIIDTGIDYQHTAFQYSDGSSRILSMWDQTIQDGTPPEGLTFGTEYSREQINNALNSDDPFSIVPTMDSDGHGTAIASIMAGTPDDEQNFSGVVPMAELVIVKLKEAKENLKRIHFVPEDAVCYQESDILLAAHYAYIISTRYRRPMVICIAMGTSQGGHNGLDVTSRYLDYLALLPGIGVSVSAGNEGNRQRHYFTSALQSPYYHDMELRVGNRDKMFSLEIWCHAMEKLAVNIFAPNQETTHPVFSELSPCRKFTFILNQTALWVNNTIFEEETGDQLILIRFSNPTQGIWRLRLESPKNESFSFHSWLPSGDMISNETYFVQSDPDTTITAPGNAQSLLTVAAYNHWYDSILVESGRGYMRNNQIKPDIAAPGYQLPCAVPGNRYGTATGTGAAAAHAAGIIAMLFEWAVIKEVYPRMTGNIANHLLIRNAIRNPSSAYPNRVWGYGQAEINRIFEQLSSYHQS